MRVVVPGTLREWTGGRTELDIEEGAATAAEALAALWERCPGLRDRIMDEQGRIREHINVFIGEDNIKHRDGLKTSIHPGDAIFISKAVSGG